MKLSAALILLSAGVFAAAPSFDKAKAVGNPYAPLTIELFSDFQCPTCRLVHMQMLPSILKDYVIPGKVFLVYKEFPLPGHAHAKEAATYAVAASRVGKYEQVADVLFEKQPSWAADGKVFETVSTALTPAEQKKVQTLAKDPAVITEVEQEVKEGIAEQVNGTPTMIIVKGAKKYPIVNPSYDLLRRFLDDLAK
jgi:protein-disulfide isomerase